MQDRRVVITGLGAVTPLGNNVNAYWEAIKAVKNGIGPITRFDASQHPTKIAGEVKGFDPANFIDAKLARRLDPFTQFALVASLEALGDSGLVIDEENADRVGTLIASGIGGCLTWMTNTEALRKGGPRRVSPFFVPMLTSNMASGVVSIEMGAKGPSFAITSACASSSHAIGEAWHIIKRGDADVMFAGGAEAAVSPLAYAGFCTMKAVSTRNDDPEHASRPFDVDRDGFVMGEGAGIMILEELEHAKKRGAAIHGEIVGYGCSADAYDMVANSPEGACRSMTLALKKARIAPEKIDYINAHATSTPLGDPSETQAIKMAFGDNAYKTSVSGTKSMIGHLLGAAGVVEGIACVKAICEGVIPPTRNLENPDPLCDLDCVPNEPREASLTYVMNNSFGFGGQNATTIFKKFTD